MRRRPVTDLVRLHLGTWLLAAAAACAPERTMLVVRVESDIAVPDAMDRVRVVVVHAGKQLQSLPFSLAPGQPGAYTLPIEVGLVSPSGGGDGVEIDVSGSLGQQFVVGQDAITSFVRGRSLVLDMFLAADCVGFVCPDLEQTCTKGQRCVDKARVASTLPPFDPHDAAPEGARRGDGGLGSGAAGSADAGGGGAGGLGGGGAGGAAGGSAGRASGPDASVDARDAAPELKPGCTPAPEDCFNGLDDDCDGLNDCADPDCAPTAVCVPRPSGTVGTVVGAADLCPKGFAPNDNGATPYGLTIGSGGTTCSGCQCAQTVSTTSCSAALTTYTSTADCQAATNGKDVLTVSSTTADPCPVPDTSTTNVFGAALSAWTVTSASCGPTGTPVRPTASFATSTGFCQAATVLQANPNTGCVAGSVCMRRPPAGNPSCVLLVDASACPAGTKTSAVVYAGLQDDRACGACTCDVQGASCDALVVQMGSDYGCGLDTADLKGGARVCTTAQPTSGVYAPGYHLSGVPTNGACKPTSALTGSVTATGGRSLCCLP
ncbi:MAG TPA: hypothetical protein VHL80_17805 [Polyangia bacterium]|nr:hypothetical protein [Polyangia bacterium]